MKVAEPKVRVAQAKRKGPRYTPISRRNERPGAIKWLVRNHPELKDAQIMRLVGTTKSTIESVREGTHWNTANLAAIDPVTLGLCSQIDLDMEVRKASGGRKDEDVEHGTRLLSAEEAMAAIHGTPAPSSEPTIEFPLGDSGEPRDEPEEEEFDADSVFAKLKTLKHDDDDY